MSRAAAQQVAGATTRRTTCRACEDPRLKVFLDLGMMPLAGGFLPDTPEAMARDRKYPLPVYVCESCGLVQILDCVDPEILFQDYTFSSSTIGPLVQHFQDYAKWLVDRLHPRTVLEFGCNDGVLLAPLQKLGVKAMGVDPSKNIADIARGKGLDVMTAYLGESTADAILKKFGPVDLLTGSNVFAHQDRPESILNAAKKLLKPEGFLCLEVMYAGDLLELLQWDTLYHEHLTFYSLGTLQRLLDRYSLRIVEAERVPMHAGSLRVVATANPRAPAGANVERIREYEKEKRLADPATWVAFGEQVKRQIHVTGETLRRLSRQGTIWAYGASGRSTMWVNACGMDYLGAVADASPLRAGRRMPGTHTPIVFPEELKKKPPDYILVTAWNYADHIRAKEQWFKGIWCVPAPHLRFF